MRWVAVAMVLSAAPAWAAPAWDQLTPAQQEVLRGLESDWTNLPEERRELLARGAERWAAMTPAEQEQAQSRLARWKDLDPERRERVLRMREQFRSMTPEQREQLRSRYQQFRSLPTEERARIRSRFQELRVRPGGIESECGMTDIQGKLDCLGVPGPVAEPRATKPGGPDRRR